MGYRTLVILNNDHLHELRDDPQAGTKLYTAACGFRNEDRNELGNYGVVVQVEHADVATLAVIGPNGTFAIKPLAYTMSWKMDNPELYLLREAADKLGYRLVKKPTRKPT